jgi:hypothetical protein
MTKDKILEKALREFEEAEDFEENTRRQREEDLKFFLGDSDNEWQWPEQIVKLRKQPGKPARPTLTMNKMPLHVRQITNEQRQNRPSIKVRPVDDRADKEVAEVFDGLIRHIQDVSDAESAYDTACEHQTVAGLGYWRILTEYEDDSFDQCIRIARIRNPFKVYLDPYIQTPEGSDAEYGFIFEDIPVERFKREYPNAKPASWEPDQYGWVTRNTVRIAEYFCASYEDREIGLLPDGSTVFTKDSNGPFLKTRTIQDRKVTWYKMTSFEILEEREWPSRYIGIVRVVGEEWEVDGKLVVKGLVRNAKDAQRMYNFWTSAEAEMAALQPKAPFIGAKGAFKGFESKWQMANVENLAYLEYNTIDVDGNPAPPPQRQIPPAPAAAFIQAKLGASEDIKATTSQFNASLGQEGNEKSGRAILARQKEGDTANFHYLDNLSKAIRHTGRILIDMIPRLYDTQRVARILGEDGNSELVMLNPEMPDPRQPGAEGIKGIYNLNVGKYDVSVSVGPSFTTKRQEAAEFMTQIAQSVPTVIQQAGDIILEQFDMPGADRLSKRLKKFLPPGIVEEDDDDPESKLAAMQGQMQQLEQALQSADAMMDQVEQVLKQTQDENQMLKVQNANKQAEVQQKERQAELNAATAIEKASIDGTVDIKVAEIAAQVQDMGNRLSALQNIVKGQQNAGISEAAE